MIMYQQRVYTEDLRNNESVYYLFADNDARTGYGSFRSYPNFVGIRIKKISQRTIHSGPTRLTRITSVKSKQM